MNIKVEINVKIGEHVDCVNILVDCAVHQRLALAVGDIQHSSLIAGIL